MRAAVISGAMLLAAGGTAPAQPARHESPKSVRTDVRPRQVVLASADAEHAQGPAARLVSEPKRPAPRISHCRCGDQEPGTDNPDQ